MKRKMMEIGLLFSLTMLSPALAGEVKLVKTTHGATMKVIARTDTATFAEPNRDSASRPVRQFEFFLVAQPGKSKKGGIDFYPVVESEEGPIVGWIPVDSVVEWSHRLAFLPTPSTDREPIAIAASLEDATAYLNRTGKPNLIGKEPRGVDGVAFFPVLEELTARVGNEQASIFRTVFMFGSSTAHDGGTASGVTAKRLSNEITLDVVFVIDGTGSMGPWIKATRDTVREIANSIRGQIQLADRIRFGLVVYRDTSDGTPSQIVCRFEAGKKPDTFLHALDGVEAKGGGDQPEQVFLGVYQACSELDWNPIANRHLILIGDAPSHEGEQGLKSIDAALAVAQPAASPTDFAATLKKITIHALRVGNATDDGSALCSKQFQTLAAGRDNPGFYSEVSDKTRFVREVSSFIAARAMDVEDAATGKFAEAALRAKTNSDGHRGALGAVIDSLSESPIAPGTFGEGFVPSIDRKGNATIIPHVLVSRRDLSRFHATLEFFGNLLRNEAEPGSRDVTRIVGGLQQALLTMELHEEVPPVDSKTKLSHVLSLALGLPLRNPLFDVDVERLKAMTQADFQTVVTGLSASEQLIKAHLSTGSFFNLGRETRAQYQFSFIRLEDLP